MRKSLVKSLIPVLFISLFLPFIPVEAGSGYFTYRETKMGSGTKQTSQWEYEVTNEKYNFGPNESVFALSRIFNITNISTFQFKYEIRGAVSRDAYSPVYKPSKNWWAEIWYWDEFGPLPSGSYDLNVMISVDGAAYKRLDSKKFSVSGSSVVYNQTSTSNQSSCGNASYRFDWVETGKGMHSIGAYAYETINKTASFNANENVYVLAKNSSLKGVDSFRLKFEVYQNGQSFYKANEVPTMYPRCATWGYNYSWANLGSLPTGHHEIRTYIQINNGAYQLLNRRNISISPTTYPVYNYQTPVKPGQNYQYNWTQLDNEVKNDGDFRFSMSNPRNEFCDQENVKALTKLTDISGIKRFTVRHDLYKDGQFVKKIVSMERYPNNSLWRYNFIESDFGKLSVGNYETRAYISVDGSIWNYLDAKQFSVFGVTSNCYNPNIHNIYCANCYFNCVK